MSRFEKRRSALRTEGGYVKALAIRRYRPHRETLVQTVMRAVHYLNQYFARAGAEEASQHLFTVRDGAVGPGMAALSA